MVQLNNLALAGFLGSAAALAVPVASPVPTAPATLAKRDSCTFSGSDGAASASKSKSDCSTIIISAVTVPAGEELNLKDLEDDTTVIFEGTTTWEYDEWDGPLLYISGTGITVTGADGHWLDGNGAEWWDGEGSNGGVTKPKFFYAHDLIDSTITGLNIKNTPEQSVSINGAENLSIVDMTIDNSDGDTDELGHNTDAFDISSSTGVYISGATVYNQDDCVAINSGTDISFTGGYCSGGHGLSIGSVGGRSDNDVENVYFSNCTVTNSENGVRIKTVYDATGTVSNITYSDITLSEISDYGIVIEQDYENGSPTGTPTDGISISDVTLDGISGSIESDAVNIYILCGSDSCTDWTWSDITISGGEDSDDCENVPDGATCSTSS